jgi:serine/threonine protein kinase/tetratricopeptide (TPR) repeat protein
MTFEHGQMFSHFKILRKLGEGGMGEVYLAEDQKLGRQVALKILLAEFFDSRDRMDRFNREARTAAQITHPHVMAIHDIGSAPDEKAGRELSYIVMEYIEGESLTNYLANRSRSIGELLRISEKIAAGLAAAHKLGIVHRDIKTDNIIINDDNQPKILDFGLAKPIVSAMESEDDVGTKTVSQELTQEGKILGTVTYMSPEQARGEQVDSRSDIFSFGIMLYKMFTSEFPFEGSDKVSTLAKILEARHTPIRQKNPSLPAELERIIDKCLQKKPDDRYQDTRDLVIDLRSLRKQHESGISDTDSFIADLPMKTKGKFSPFAIMSAALIIVAAVVIVFLMTREPDGSGSTARADIPRVRENALAVLDFENTSNDDDLDWLSAGLPEILTTDLSQNPKSNIISRNRVLSCLEDKINDPDKIPSHQEYMEAAQSLGASTALSGTFMKLGDKIRIDARIEEIESGKILYGEKVVGEDIYALVDSLTQKIAHALNIQEMMLENVDVKNYTSASPEAYKHYILGLEKFNRGLFDESIVEFEKALEYDSSMALAYMRIGVLLVFKSRPQMGAEYLAKAKNYEGRLPIKDRSLLDIYADLWLNTRIDDGFAKLQSYINNYPDDWEGRYLYAVFLFSFGKYDNALGQIDTLLRFDPKDRWALELASQTYSAIDSLDKAIEYAQLAKQYYPESPSSYETLGLLYRLQGKIDMAIDENKQLLKMNPENPAAARTISRMYIIKRDFENARNYIEKLREFQSDDPFDMYLYHNTKANLALWEGKFLSSIEQRHHALEQALKTNDSTYIFEGYNSISNSYWYIDMPDSSIIYAEKAKQWATIFQNFSYAFVLLKVDMQNVPRAKEVFKNTLEEFKIRTPQEFWPIADNLEIIFDAQCDGDTAAMIEAYLKFIEMPQQDINSNYSELGTLLVLNGRYEEGITQLEKLTMGPTQTTSAIQYLDCLYYIGIANQALGNTQEAIDNYREVLKYWGNPDIEFSKLKDLRERLNSLIS